MPHPAPSPARDVSDTEPYTAQYDPDRVPAAAHFIIERHVPELFETPFHHHTSVEINYLEGCALSYSFAGASVALPPAALTLFWGAQPHRVAAVSGRGQITNIYLSLGQFLRWGLPDPLVKAILSGTVLSARPGPSRDGAFFDRLWAERGRTDAPWRRTHLDEIATRLRRLGLEGWQVQLDPTHASPILDVDAAAMRRVEAILRFVADNFSRPVTVRDIASAVNLSASRAAVLFRDVMGVSIKHHLTRTRLGHARMLLTETDGKIVSVALDSGFRSLSSFYAAFSEATGVSPAQYRKEAQGG